MPLWRAHVPIGRSIDDHRWSIAVLLLLTALLCFGAGLSGPLLFDDLPNLEPVLAWQSGELGWWEVVFGNTAGPLGRPISSASFLLNVILFGDSVYALKLVNLLIHSANGFLVYVLSRMLLVTGSTRTTRPETLALLIAIAWTVNPVHVSTVLYAIQRTTMLSTTFVLLALISYLQGRRMLAEGIGPARAKSLLFLLFPALCIAAMLCKENGMLAPFLAAAMEWSLFSRKHRPRPVRTFLGVLVLLPLAIGTALALSALGDQVWVAYEHRSFSLTERLLSQPRALLAYASGILIPGTSLGSVYTDGFQASNSLFAPLTTALSIFAWLVLIALALLGRTRFPLVCCGLAFFLVGHALESSVIPLELYFEHRNYLPALGLLLAASAIVQNLPIAQRLRMGIGVGFIILCALVSHVQSTTWRSHRALATHATATLPDSIRAPLDLAALLAQDQDPGPTLQVLDRLSRKPATESARIGHLVYMAYDCTLRSDGSPERLDPLRAMPPTVITPLLTQAIEMLGAQVLDGYCKRLSPTALADLIAAYLNHSTQPKNLHVRWRLEHLIGKLRLQSEQYDRGIAALTEAFEHGGTVAPVGVDLIANLIGLGRFDDAARTLAVAKQRRDAQDASTQAILAEFENQLAGTQPDRH